MMNYEEFLVAELLFQRDELLFHTIPETEVRYFETLGKLEDEVELLNFNIQILRRMLELFHKGKTRQEIDKIVKDEYASLLDQRREKQKNRTRASDLPIVSKKERDESRNIYRQIVAQASPSIYHLTSEEKGCFEGLQRAFAKWDVDYLKSHHGDVVKDKTHLTKEKLDALKADLQLEISQYYYEFPLNQQSMLENSDALSFNLERLEDTYTEYSFIYRNLEEEYHLKWATKLTDSP